MKVLNTTMRALRSFSLKAKLATIVAAGVAVSSAAALAGYSPDRPTFDYNKAPLNGTSCTAADDAQRNRCGSMDGPVLNSFVNTPNYGDERAFFDARMSDQSAYKDVLQYPTDGTKEVVLRTYVHNNANTATNSTNGTATGAKVRIDIPTGTETALRTRSYISIDKAAAGFPTEVTDTAELVDTKAFSIKYKAGSAKIYNAASPSGRAVADSIVTTGAPIGHTANDGKLPGCFEYQATVEIVVIVTPAPTTGPTIEKVVRKAGETNADYSKNKTVKPGETLQWRLFFMNKGEVTLDNVSINDQLPPHLKVVPGSVKWRYTDANTGNPVDAPQNDTDLFTTYGNYGTWKQNGGFYLRFDTVALDDFATCDVFIRNIVHERDKQTPGERTDYADVRIVKENCNPPAASFSCTGLDLTKVNRESFLLTAHAAVSNTTVKSYGFTVTGPKGYSETYEDIIAATDSNTLIWTVDDEPGVYTASVIVRTAAGDTAPTAVCTKQFTVEAKPATPLASCDLLKAQNITARKYRFTTAYTAEGGAKFKHFVYDFGDNSTPLTTNTNPYEYTYAKDGNYIVRVKTVFTINGTDQTKESEACKVAVNIKTPTTTPTVLPDTGTGEVASLFVAVTLVGAVAHGFIARRRFNS